MCGIYGIIGQGIQRDDIIVFRDLMTVMAIRGHQSTGVAIGRSSTWGSGKNQKRKEDVTVIKKAFDPIWFQENLDKEEELAMNDTFNDFFLGHDRWATTGEITQAAAHPFEHGNIVGTHNGTFESLKLDGFHSDSDAFYNRVGELGIKAAVMTLTPKDKYALVWYDKSTGRVNFLRNKEKKFWFCYNNNRNVMYYASEVGALQWILARRNIQIEDGQYWFPKEDVMYAIDPQNLKKKGKYLFSTTEIKPMAFTYKQQQQQLPFDANNAGPAHDC